jgi:hypothetical protein
MMTDVLPLGMSLVVLRALCKINIDFPESTDKNDDNDCTNYYAHHFFHAFNNTSMFKRKKMWISFMNWLKTQLD